jgi:hypothetical protein
MSPRRPKRGRPPRPLAENPEQLELAFVERGIRANVAKGISPLQTISDYVTWQAVLRGIARPVYRQDDNLESHRRRRPGDWIKMTKVSPRLLKMIEDKHIKDSTWEWDSRNVFRPEIISMEQKLRRVRKNDSERLQVLVDICELYLSGEIGEARQLASSIGQVENFERELRRILGWVTIRFGYPFGQTLMHTIVF